VGEGVFTGQLIVLCFRFYDHVQNKRMTDRQPLPLLSARFVSHNTKESVIKCGTGSHKNPSAGISPHDTLLYHHHRRRRRRRLSRIRLFDLFRFRIYFSETYESVWIVGRIPWTEDQPDARSLPTQANTIKKNADTHPCLQWDSNPRSEFEWSKTVRALDLLAIVTGITYFILKVKPKFFRFLQDGHDL
jgi:hypothetical protein